MDARRACAASIAVAVVFLCAQTSWGGSYRTQNFLVTAPTAPLAREIGDAAEAFRSRLAIEWIGRELPPWREPCPVTAQIAPNLGAGGATSFYFENGHPFGWTMTMQGSRERVLDSVLPHEITHTIFASHFGRPLPRWADEGACTTVEHSSERRKQEKLLVEFLTTNRGIAFNKMFAMKEYPPDVLPLYSQGFSLARFLIAQGGKPKFVRYVGDGMQTNNWTAATSKHYGFENLSQLQLAWIEWVRHDSPEEQALAFSPLADQPHPSVARLVGRTNAPAPAAVSPASPASPVSPVSPASFDASLAKAAPVASPVASDAARQNLVPVVPVSGRPAAASLASHAGDGWYARQRDRARQAGVDAGRRDAAPSSRAAWNEPPGSYSPQTVTRPQPPEQARQVILEWSRPPQGSAPSSINR